MAITLDGTTGITQAGVTGATILPVGTTAQRPASPAAGMVRFNTDLGNLEFRSATSWLPVYKFSSIVSVAGNILEGAETTLTLTVLDAASTIDVVFSASGSEVARVTDAAVSAGVATATVPSAVYNLALGTVVAISIESDGAASSNSVNKTVAALPTGGTVTTYDGYRVHTFNASGTFATNGFSGNVQYIVVAGGAGGGGRGARWAGGGGGGGLRASIAGYNSGGGAAAESSFAVTASTNYTVTVGAGGTGSPGSDIPGGTGGTSAFDSITTVGGGGGGGYGGNSGGSGGGGVNGNSAGGFSENGGAGTAGQGFRGGGSFDNGAGGGGGGSAAVGSPSNAGAGVGYPIYSASLTYLAGGGSTTNAGAPNGGSGTLTAGAANSGAGGGAGFSTSGRNGGSGVVIVRYQI